MSEEQKKPFGRKVNSHHVILMGDSVLDDFYWLNDKALDVKQQLANLLKRKRQVDKDDRDGKNAEAAVAAVDMVTNYAVDESAVDHVLYSIKPNPVYSVSRKWNNLEPYPTDADGRVRPLQLLKDAEDTVTHVVLSIGGNDARAAFVSSFDVERIYDIMVNTGIIEGFNQLVEKILATCPKLMLVVVYHPHIGRCNIIHMLPPAHVIKELFVRFFPMYVNAGKKYRLPIIDLSRTFDPHNRGDYGSTPIEPSNKSGDYIAKLIAHIMDDFKFGEDPSKVYTMSTGADDNPIFVSEVLDDNFTQQVYRDKLEDHLEKCERLKKSSSCAVS